MRAMVLRAVGPLRDNPAPLEPADWPDPAPGPGEILIRVNTCGVCHTELDEIEGRTTPPRLPMILGHQVVGRVEAVGDGARGFAAGDRVGVAWAFSACGACDFCARGEENLCDRFLATGRDAPGGYAEKMSVPAEFAYPVPAAFNDAEAAPLLCAGAIGLRSLRLTGLGDVACEDGHAQERSMLPELLERIRAKSVVVADRNFCTSMFLFGLTKREAFFVIRQHGSTLTWKLRGRRRRIGRVTTGMAYEQAMELHFRGETLTVRRVTLRLDRPTEGGDTEIHIVTNLPAERATAQQVAVTYGMRWTVEGAFQTLTDVLRCEVETLGYPRAALFSFAVAVLAYNAYAVVHASLRAAHGAEVIKEKLSGYHLMNDVAATYVGMDIAVPDACWEPYRVMPVCAFTKAMMKLAHRVKLARYPKKRRGPKKPQPRKKSGRRNHHISTARLLLKRRRKTP